MGNLCSRTWFGTGFPCTGSIRFHFEFGSSICLYLCIRLGKWQKKICFLLLERNDHSPWLLLWKMGLTEGKWAILCPFTEPEHKITWRRRWTLCEALCAASKCKQLLKEFNYVFFLIWIEIEWKGKSDTDLIFQFYFFSHQQAGIWADGCHCFQGSLGSLHCTIWDQVGGGASISKHGNCGCLAKPYWLLLLLCKEGIVSASEGSATKASCLFANWLFKKPMTTNDKYHFLTPLLDRDKVFILTAMTWGHCYLFQPSSDS